MPQNGDDKVSDDTDPLAKVAERIRLLEAENARLRGEQQQTWRLQSEVSELRHKLDAAEKEKARLREEMERTDAMARFWRKAVRYEQQMKKPPKKVRHLPVYNGVHRGRHRFDGWTNRERVFLKHWRDENRRKAGINGGHGLLELVLSNDINGAPADVTQRDAEVAATVIQWLGTNCGFSLLHTVNRECEAKEKKSRDSRRAAARVSA